VDLESLAIKITRNENLGALSPVIRKIVKLAPDPMVGAKALESALNSEPGLTAKVLKAANSSYYALKSPANTVGSAVLVLGMRTVQALVLSVAYQQGLQGASPAPNFNRLRFWQHSIATAMAARKLAQAKGYRDPDEHYTIGMLHEIGMLALEKYCAKEWDRALGGAARSNLPLNLVEEQLLGFSHRNVSSVVLEKWGMDARIVACALHIHAPPLQNEHAESIALLSVADLVACHAGFGNQAQSTPPEFDPIVLDLLGVEEAIIEKAIESLPADVQRAQESFRIAA